MKLDWKDSVLYGLSRLRNIRQANWLYSVRMLGLAPRAPAWACRQWALLKLAGPSNFLNVAIQQFGSSYPLSLIKRASSSVVRMLTASFMTSSIVRRAR